MFKSHSGYKRRSSFLPYVIFRSLLSLTIFAVLLLGIYSAYKHFSGYDPINIDPKALVLNLVQENLDNLPTDNPVGFLTKILSIGLKKDEQSVEEEDGEVSGVNLDEKESDSRSNPAKKASLAFKFMLVADSHSENENLKKALFQAKQEHQVNLVIGLGDYSEVGTLNELQITKKIFDEGGLRYFLTVGDHDLWDSRDKSQSPTGNFNKLFGSPFQSFSYDNSRFIVVYNSDNYDGLGEEQLNWLREELERIKKENTSKDIFVMLHEPLYHPSSDRVMGKVEPKLKEQAKSLIAMFSRAGVKEVFAGDIHFFTRYKEPESSLQMTTVGSAATLRNAQNARFAIVSVFDDGSYKVEDIEIK